MRGEAWAPGAISFVNAIMCGRGAAAAIDQGISARVTLDRHSSTVTASTTNDRDVDTTLVERCLEATIDSYGDGEGGHVETTATIPPAVGLKTSSAAANATIAATLDALGRWEDTDATDAVRLGVDIARAVGVTVTGAYDDAMASMHGGVVVTDNREDACLAHLELDRSVVIVIPDTRQPTRSVDVDALRTFDEIGSLALDLLEERHPDLAMTVNGLAVTTALGYDPTVIRRALAHDVGVSPSGTGPAIAAIGSPSACTAVARDWQSFGEVLRSALRPSGLEVR